MSGIELKPCPWCGVVPVSESVKGQYHTLYLVRCVNPNCAAQASVEFLDGSTKQAAEYWNERAPVTPDPTPALLDDAAAQIERALAGDMQEAADVLTVWGYIKEHGGVFVARRLCLDYVEDGKEKAIHFSQDWYGDGRLHQAAEWIRARQQEAQDAE